MSNSKYFDSIKIGTTRKKKKAQEPVKNKCQWEGCEKPATHKAPLGRDHEGQYTWMCLAHVQQYNKEYNYFSGLDDDGAAKIRKESLTGDRPTWTVGSNSWAGGVPPTHRGEGSQRGAERLYNRSNPAAKGKTGGLAGSRNRKLKALEKKSLDDLNLSYSASANEIKARYKTLVKENHPDANQGDRSSEERLRQVIQAYKILQKSGFC